MIKTFITILICSFHQYANAQEQDSAFIACGSFSDRAERIACLEDALEAAMSMQAENEDAPGIETIGITAPVRPAVPSTPPTPETAAAQRVENFGQVTARVENNDTDEGALIDEIVELEARKDLWRITLASGQVWQQQLARRYNLREGDTVTIERRGFGNGFRLSSDRLSGFIRVERIE